MRIVFSMLCLSGLLFVASVPAIVHAGEAQPSPLIGEWSVDLERLPMPPEARPRSVRIVFAEAEAGAMNTRVEVVYGEGQRMSAVAITRLDGTPAQVTGSLEADETATTLPAPNVLVMQLARGGIPASTRVFTVSADGSTMTETVAYVGADGHPLMRTNHFNRVR